MDSPFQSELKSYNIPCKDANEIPVDLLSLYQKKEQKFWFLLLGSRLGYFLRMNLLP